VEQLGVYCKSPEYPTFLKKLIVQGLIKIEEQVVEIQARAEDKAIVAKIVSLTFISFNVSLLICFFNLL